jgi:5-methylcytosine-specific restriction endonuclease McrA
MINFEKLERRLRVLSKRQNIIKAKNLITYEELQRLQDLAKEYKREYLSECIEGETNGHWSHDTKHIEFKIELQCVKCKENYVESGASKDRLMGYLYKEYPFFETFFLTCPKCKEIEKREKLIERIKYDSPEEKQKRSEIIRCNTINFINTYLDPNKSFKEGVKSITKWNDVTTDISNSNEQEIAEHIQGMEYLDFLNTPYWDAVRSKKLFQAYYKCSLCDSNIDLQVHHKTYEHHGYEHENLDDLIVLCGNCHSKHHGKEGN